MPTHDYSLANQSGASFRTDLNNALAAIQSNNSNSSSPSTTVAYQWWADTTANIFKIRNSSNNAWINLFTLAGGIDVDAASNFNEDVTFTGASANIVFDKSDNALEFADSASAKFGADGDLEIKHNNDNSFITDTGTGQLLIQASGLRLRNYPEGHTQVNCQDDLVELYFDNTKVAETLSTGFRVNNQFSIGESVLNFEKSGTHHHRIVGNDTGGDLGFQQSADNGSNTNFTTYLRINDGGDISLPVDNQKLKIGASADLQIFHNGGTSNTNITNTTGNLFINATSSEVGVLIKPNDAVSLYFDNSQKFFTNSLGVTVESTGNTPTLEFRGASNLDLGKIEVDQFTTNNSLMKFSTLSSGTQGEVLRLLDNKQILLSKTTNSSASQSGIVVSANGNCQYSHVGTTDHDFLEFNRGTDGSMNRIGLIRTSGSGTIYNTTSDYRLKENAVAISDGITRLKTLKPYRFNFKIEPDKTVDGFFAHEVTAVPEAITGTKDEVDSDNKPVYQGIDHSRLIPLLVAAVQELITKVETLEAA